MGYGRFQVVGVVSALFAGCLGMHDRPPASALDVSLGERERPAARLYMAETDVYGGDGMRSANVTAMAGEISNIVNEAMVEALRNQTPGSAAFALVVPDAERFGRPVTLAASALLDARHLRGTRWSGAPPAGEWTAAVRNAVQYEVFSDTVELQVVSVLTVFAPDGRPGWQATARSRKYYDLWSTGDELAHLSVRFVVAAAKENVALLRRTAEKKP